MLATNVAETSLTVPGIRYVVDPGTARISRYSHRTKVQRLPIEPISQASANQRKGRCGRVADGICIRLYAEDDFDARPEFTEPEILRTNLASVILQMTALGLGDIAAFPFVDPPDRRNITRRRRSCCEELGALDPAQTDPRKRLTAARPQAGPAAGRPAAGPDGPRGRPATAACARCWSSPPRCPSRTRASGRPTSSRQADAAARAGSRTETRTSSRYLNLWDYLQRAAEGAVAPASSAGCASAEFLHYLRVREWQDICTPSSGRSPSSSGIAVAEHDAGSGRRRAASTARCSPACSRTSACSDAGASASTWAPAAPSSRSSPARRCSRSRRAG